MSGVFEINKAKDGQFFFNLKAGNGEIILTSELYKQKESAQKGIASVQNNSGDVKNYDRLTASNGKFYFTLKAVNHQVIGKSQMYMNEAGRDKGIESVKTNGSTKTVKDLSV